MIPVFFREDKGWEANIFWSFFICADTSDSVQH